MIIGVGIDAVETSRIREAMQKEGFLKRIYTENEMEMFRRRGMNAQTLAGNFAGKEAVMKAFGRGMDHFAFRDIEIMRTAEGAPSVRLYGAAKEAYAAVNAHAIHVSISNLKELAMAQAVLEG